MSAMDLLTFVLSKLTEECSEMTIAQGQAGKVVGKINRFGLASCAPGSTVTNQQDLFHQLANLRMEGCDVQAVVLILRAILSQQAFPSDTQSENALIRDALGRFALYLAPSVTEGRLAAADAVTLEKLIFDLIEQSRQQDTPR